MEDTTQTIRAHRRAEINAAAADREVLSATYGQVWDTAELTAEFEVIGFLAPFVVVQRKCDRQRGSLEFQHHPRFYFNFMPD